MRRARPGSTIATSSNNTANSTPLLLGKRSSTSSSISSAWTSISNYQGGPAVPTSLESNPIARQFNNFQYVCHTAPENEPAWRVFEARGKQSQKVVSVFFFEKRETGSSSKSSSKFSLPGKTPASPNTGGRRTLVELQRRDACRLGAISHPRILDVLHQIEENKDSIAFATEPITGTLYSILRHRDGKDFAPFEPLEVKCGLLQLAEALSYLHQSAGVLHGNVSPSAVFVTPDGRWKLAAFAFSQTATRGSTDCFPTPLFGKNTCSQMKININFAAPEVFSKHSVTSAADVYSLGALTLWLYSGAAFPTMSQKKRPSSAPPVRVIECNGNVNETNQKIAVVESISDTLGASLSDALRKMLSSDVRERPSTQLFTMIKHFDEPSVSCLRQLDDLPRWKDAAAKSQFLFTTLKENLSAIPEVGWDHFHAYDESHLWVTRLLPRLTEEIELASDGTTTYQAVAQPLFYMLEHCDSDHIRYFQPIVTKLILLCSERNKLLVCTVLENLSVVFSRICDNQLEDKLLDMIMSSITSNNIQLQTSALNGLPKIGQFLSPNFIRQNVFGGVEKFVKTYPHITHMQLMALKCLRDLTQSYDASCIDPLISLIGHINVSEPENAIGVSKLFAVLLSESSRLGITASLITNDALPPLLKMLTNDKFTSAHFDQVMATIRLLLNFVEEEQYRRLFGNAEMPHRISLPSRTLLPNMQSLQRLSNSINYIPQVLVTSAASPSTFDGGNGSSRKGSFHSEDGRLSIADASSESRRSSGESLDPMSPACMNPSSVGSYTIYEEETNGGRMQLNLNCDADGRRRRGSDLPPSMMATAVMDASTSCATPRRRSWLTDCLYTASVDEVQQRSAKSTSQPQTLLPRRPQSAAASPEGGRRHSYVGILASGTTVSGVTRPRSAVPPTPTNGACLNQRPNSFTNLGHNLACTLWKNLY